jgi:hypothetical protein
MAVSVIMDFEGATLEQYDEVMRRMGLDAAGAEMPAGGLFHWAVKTADGIRVIDVWESQEQFEAFSSSQIGPHTAAAGVPGPPRVEIAQVHNHLAG